MTPLSSFYFSLPFEVPFEDALLLPVWCHSLTGVAYGADSDAGWCGADDSDAGWYGADFFKMFFF